MTCMNRFAIARRWCRGLEAALNTRRLSSDRSAYGLGSAERPYDVIISGGGMVGTALACALSQRIELNDKHVLLLEASGAAPTLPTADEMAKKQYSNRVSALTLETAQFLEGLDAWQSIASARCQPFRRIHVWDACADSRITFEADAVDKSTAPSTTLHSPSGSGTMGTIVENWLVHAALSDALERQSGNNTAVRFRARVKSVGCSMWQNGSQSKEEDSSIPWAAVNLEDGTTLYTRLLVGADGPNSLVRQSSGLDAAVVDYEQSAVVATLYYDEVNQANRTAYQRFLPTGPIALLPLSETATSLVWSTTRKAAKELCSMSDTDFVDSVNNAFRSSQSQHFVVESANSAMRSVLQVAGSLLGRKCVSASTPEMCRPVVAVDEGSRASFPLGKWQSVEYFKPRLALVGDAAHRVHPLAGQGVNLGFYDVPKLCNALVHALEEGQDVGSAMHLKEYERQCFFHLYPNMAVIDGLKHLYSTSLPPLVLARSLGLQLTDALAPLKSAIVSSAMGPKHS